jgi:hypothetical protein
MIYEQISRKVCNIGLNCLFISLILLQTTALALKPMEIVNQHNTKQLIIISILADLKQDNSSQKLQRALQQCFYNFYDYCYNDVKVLFTRYLFTLDEESRNIEYEKYRTGVNQHLIDFFENSHN